MTNAADRQKSLVWSWIIEYIASFPQINISLLHEIVDSCPKPPGDLPENVVEMVALRSLEQLFGPVEDLSSDNRIDLSLRCIDVLSAIVSEQMTLLELSEQSKRDIRLFIRHKRDSMPTCSLEKLKQRILKGAHPCAASGVARVVSKDGKHDRNTKGNGHCDELVGCCDSSSQDQTKLPQLMLGELGRRNSLTFKRGRGERNKFSEDFHENLDCLNGGDEIDGRSKRCKLDSACITQSTEQNSFHLHGKDVMGHSSKQKTDLAEKETEVLQLGTSEKEAFHVEENQVEKETEVLGGETAENSFHLHVKDAIESSKQITNLAEKETEVMELETSGTEAFHVEGNQVEKETAVLDLETSVKEFHVEETQVLDVETAEKETEASVKEFHVEETQVLDVETAEKETEALEPEKSEEFHVEENQVEKETEMLDLKTSEKEFHVEDAEVLDVESAEKEEFQMHFGGQQTEHDDILCGQKDSNSRRSRVKNLPSKLHGNVYSEMERSNQANGEDEAFSEHHVVKRKGGKQRQMLKAQCTHSRQEEPNITGREAEVMIPSIRALKKHLKKKVHTRLSGKSDNNLRSNGGNGYPPAVQENENMLDVGCDQANSKVIVDNNLRSNGGNGYPPAVQENESLRDVGCDQANSKVIGDNNLRSDGGNGYPPTVQENGSLQDEGCDQANGKVISDNNLRSNRGIGYPLAAQQNGSPQDVECVQTNSNVIGDHHMLTKEEDKQPQEPESLSKQCRQGELDFIGGGTREMVPSLRGLGLSTVIQIRLDHLKERIGMLQRKDDCKLRSKQNKNLSPKMQENAKIGKVGCDQEKSEILSGNDVLNREREKQSAGRDDERLQEGLKQQNLGTLEEQEEHLNAINTAKRDSSDGESDESIISNYPIRVRMKRRRCKY